MFDSNFTVSGVGDYEWFSIELLYLHVHLGYFAPEWCLIFCGRLFNSECVAGKAQDTKNVNIATKFAAYPWRLTPSQIVSACKYV